MTASPNFPPPPAAPPPPPAPPPPAPWPFTPPAAPPTAPEHKGAVEFGGKSLAFCGILFGGLMGTLVPGVALSTPGLPAWLRLVVRGIALVVGGAVAAISAFFGIVIPSRVHGGGR